MIQGRTGALSLAALTALAGAAGAQPAPCPIPHDQLVDALKASVQPSGGPANGGFDNHQWAAVVARDGTVCAVAFSGNAPDEQWPGSRGIAAQKAGTANAMSVDKSALSTANLYAGALPGGPLYGIEAANPPATDLIAGGDPAQFGTPADPMLGKTIGGLVVFGGGLALYDDSGVVGGLGISGDSSCADHNVAWRVRAALGLDKVRSGVGGDRKDAIIYDLNHEDKSASGFGHAQCLGTESQIGNELGAAIGGERLQ